MYKKAKEAYEFACEKGNCIDTEGKILTKKNISWHSFDENKGGGLFLGEGLFQGTIRYVKLMLDIQKYHS